MASQVIGTLRVDLGIDSAQFTQGLKNAQSALARFGSTVKKGLTVVAAGAGVAAAGLAVAVKGTIDAADDMSKAASKIGIPIEELSRLKYAADLSGVSFEGLQTAVGRLSRVMSDAQSGSKEAIGAFDDLGISATNADGSLKPATQVLSDIADKFAAMPDGAGKTAAAMKLMGRSGANMIPLLNGGSGALKKLTDEADQFGQVFTKEMGSSAEAFNDNISRLQGALATLAAKITAQLLPYLEKFTNWLVENSPAIAEFVGKVVEFGAGLVKVASDIGAALSQFNSSMQGINQALTQFLENVRSGLQGAVEAIAQKIQALKETLVRFADEVQAAFASLPARMVEIGSQIINGLWQGIQAKWETVKSGITGLANGLVGSVKSTLGIQSPSTVMYGIGQNIMQGLNNGMQSLAGNTTGGASSIALEIGSAFQGIGQSIGDAIAGTKEWGDVLKDILKSIANFVVSKIDGGGIFGGLLQTVFGSLTGFATGGNFMVGGTGGIDSQLVAFRATPGERVSIDRRGEDGNKSTYVVNNNINAQGADPAALARVQTALRSLERNVPSMVDARVNARQTRRTRP